MSETFHIVDGNGNIHAHGDGPAMLARGDLLTRPGYRMVKANPTPPTAPARLQAPPAPPASVNRQIIPGNTINPEAQKRIAAMNAAATAAGFAFDGTLFAYGTDMLPCGVDRFHALRREYADAPLFRDVADAFLKAFALENRRDVVIDDMAGAVLTPDGWLKIGGRKAKLSERGLRTLLQRFSSVFPSAWSWATVMGAEARAVAVTDGFARLAKLPDTGRRAMLRIRDDAGTGDPLIYAAVGTRYPARASDADAIVRGVLAKLDERGQLNEARGTIDYDRPNTKILASILYAAEHVTDPAVGDIFRGGVAISSADDASAAAIIRAYLERVRCINCTTHEAEVETGRRIHRVRASEPETFVRDVADQAAAAQDMIEPLLGVFRQLREIDFSLEIERDGEKIMTADPTEVVTAAVEHPDLLAAGLKDAGIGRDAAVELILGGWKLGENDGDNSGSMADLVNAVTRAAQSRTLDAFQRFAMERAAGAMMPVLAASAEA